MKDDNDLIDLDLSKLDLRKIQKCTLLMMMNEGKILLKVHEQ